MSIGVMAKATFTPHALAIHNLSIHSAMRAKDAKGQIDFFFG